MAPGSKNQGGANSSCIKVQLNEEKRLWGNWEDEEGREGLRTIEEAEKRGGAQRVAVVYNELSLCEMCFDKLRRQNGGDSYYGRRIVH